jgi:CRISPR-associated protein Csx3
VGQYFTASISSEAAGVVTLNIGFSKPATNTIVLPDAIAAIAELKLPGGRGVRFNGRASLPVAMALAHSVAHLYGYVACYDPKLQGYVVAISHDPALRPGQLLLGDTGDSQLALAPS